MLEGDGAMEKRTPGRGGLGVVRDVGGGVASQFSPFANGGGLHFSLSLTFPSLGSMFCLVISDPF